MNNCLERKITTEVNHKWYYIIIYIDFFKVKVPIRNWINILLMYFSFSGLDFQHKS